MLVEPLCVRMEMPVFGEPYPCLLLEATKCILTKYAFGQHIPEVEMEVSEGCLGNKRSHPTRYHLCYPRYGQFKRCFFLHRLPASHVWSTRVPRPDGSAAAASESGRDEQPTRNCGAKRDGLLPNDVFVPGARQQHGRRGA